ncbi:FecR family protein [Flavitalea flava]
MDLQPSYDDLPWELIAAALQGGLTPDEDLRFGQWLALSQENRQKYDQLQHSWKDGMEDYGFYREANATKGWDALRKRIEPSQANSGVKAMSGVQKISGVKEIDGAFNQRRTLARRLAAAAAVLTLVAGAGWWYISGKSSAMLYETAFNEQKKISLPDGSTMSLHAQTHIRIVPGYNKTGRTIILAGGEAHFEISHREQLPFTVEMDGASVKDIGTGFTIQRTKDSIKVIVSSGKVAFIKKETGESRELSAGNSLCYYIAEHHFGELRTTDPANSGGSLRFDNAPLSEVINALQKVFDKKIRLNDTAIAQKRLTVHLDGETFDNDLRIICASLNLEYAETDGVYWVKTKDTEAHP